MFPGTPELVEWGRTALGDEFSIVELADSAHHVMIDQPLARHVTRGFPALHRCFLPSSAIHPPL